MARMIEAPGASEFADKDHGSDKGDAAQTHQGFHNGLHVPAFQQGMHLILQPRDAFPGRADRGDGILDHHPLPEALSLSNGAACGRTKSLSGNKCRI